MVDLQCVHFHCTVKSYFMILWSLIAQKEQNIRWPEIRYINTKLAQCATGRVTDIKV